MKKKITYIIVLFSISVFSLLLGGACSSGTGIHYDTDIENGSVYATEEFGLDFILPDIYVVDDNDDVVGEVTVKVLNPKGEETETPYGILKLNMIGEYSITVSYKKLDDLKYKVVCQDTIMPEITIKTAPVSLEKDKTYSCVVFDYSDRAGINYDTLKYSFTFFDGTTETPVIYNEFTNEFTADRYGWYIFRTEVEDINGNKSSAEKRMYVKDKSWVDDTLSGKMLATFDQEKYINIFSEGIVLMWESLNSESYLEEYDGETGVIKVNCPYNNVLTGQATTRVRLPKPVHKDSVEDVKIRLRVEQNFDKTNLYFFHYNNEKDVPVYGNEVISNPNNITQENNLWVDLIIPNDKFDGFADEDGFVYGFQLGTNRGYVNSSLSVDIYFSYMVGITQLSTPQNLAVNNTELTWDAVPDATYYEIVMGEEIKTTSSTAYDIGLYEGKISVIAKTDNYMFRQSEAATVLHLIPPEGYLAYYNSNLYEGSALISPNPTGKNSEIKAQEVLDSYTDKNGVTVENVMKLTVFSGEDSNNIDRARTNVTVKLPKGYSEKGFTIKYAIDYANLSDCSFHNLGRTDFIKTCVNANNTWATTYVPMDGASDKILLSFWSDNTRNVDFNVYLAWVKEGDARVIEIPDGYLAYYNDVFYADSVEIVPNGTGIESAVTGQEILASYTDANGITVENVMRITVFSGYCETGLERARANVKVRLPKGYTAAGYTLKYAIDFAAMSTYGFFNPDMTASTTWDCENTDNTWQETYVDINNAGDEIIMTFFTADSTRDTFHVYLAWVKEGDATH